MARRTCRRRSSCATVTPPRTGRRRRAGGSGRRGRRAPATTGGLALARTECQPSIREGPRPALRSRARGEPLDGAERVTRTADRVTGGRCRNGVGRTEVGSLIFKAVRNGRPYPEHGLSPRDWAMIPPRQIRLDTLVTTKRELALDTLLADDSTFYGDLFPHAVQWHGDLYLEDGLHRALRAALQQRTVIHVRVLDLDALMPADPFRAS
ncbi:MULTISPECIES: type II toxin-antitoxin system VapB family antitoxin [unclassified Geodermatophilus]